MGPRLCCRKASRGPLQLFRRGSEALLHTACGLQGTFGLVEKLFGIEIEEAQASVWHPDVKYFEVKRNGEKIAAFYADLYAREGKRSGAWMDGERTRRIEDGKLITPIAYLVTNLRPRRQAVKPR